MYCVTESVNKHRSSVCLSVYSAAAACRRAAAVSSDDCSDAASIHFGPYRRADALVVGLIFRGFTIFNAMHMHVNIGLSLSVCDES